MKGIKVIILICCSYIFIFSLIAQKRFRSSPVKVNKLQWPINTGSADLAPSLSANGQVMVFQSNRRGSKGSFDLYEVFWQGSNWSSPVNLTSINSQYFEGYPSLSPDGRTLYFSTNRHRSDENDPDIDIWYSTKNINNAWSQPKPMQILNSDDVDMMPTLSNNGDKIYFASDRSGGLGGMDIWVSSKKDDYYGKPELVPEPISSKYNDSNPFVTAAGDTFYFSSDRPGGFGKYDIYEAKRRTFSSFWQTPKNIGPEVNTATNDYFFSIPNIGSSIFISRGESGLEDIFEVRQPRNMHHLPTILLKVQVQNELTGEPVVGVPVLFELISSSKATNRKFLSNRKKLYRTDQLSGSFTASLLVGTEFKVSIRHDDYQYYQKFLNYSNIHASEEKELKINISNRATISKFAGVYFQTSETKLSDESKVALGLYIAYLKSHRNQYILLAGFADSRGSTRENRRLGRLRSESVRDYLVKKGVNPSRIFTSGGGIKGNRNTFFNAEKMQYYRTVQIKIVKPK